VTKAKLFLKLYLEHFEILEQVKQWSRIKLQYDSYEGWVDSKQYQILSEANFIQLSNDAIILSADLIEYITGDGNILLPVPLGSSLSFLNHDINRVIMVLKEIRLTESKIKKHLITTAYLYLNAPICGWKNTVRNRLFRIYSNGLQTKRLSTAARCFATSNAGRTTKFH
jgi:hypothetical protein